MTGVTQDGSLLLCCSRSRSARTRRTPRADTQSSAQVKAQTPSQKKTASLARREEEPAPRAEGPATAHPAEQTRRRSRQRASPSRRSCRRSSSPARASRARERYVAAYRRDQLGYFRAARLHQCQPGAGRNARVRRPADEPAESAVGFQRRAELRRSVFARLAAHSDAGGRAAVRLVQYREPLRRGNPGQPGRFQRHPGPAHRPHRDGLGRRRAACTVPTPSRAR